MNIDYSYPEISNEDIKWVTSLMQLPDDAFLKDEDNRADILKESKSVDVCACPGSGKTTLLVAKLAILANKWMDKTRGLCVLSHTNAARKEIEDKLGKYSVGQKLLSYPHYIGTIQSFINSYIALPILRSKNIPINIIDDNYAYKKRFSLLPYNIKHGLVKALGFKSNQDIQIKLSPAHLESNFADKDNESISETKRQICQVLLKSYLSGIFTYQDMFTLGMKFITDYPNIVHNIHDRFPMLLIDEAQDNDDKQTNILNKIFSDENHEVICQRYGDDDQAIYDNNLLSSSKIDFPVPSKLMVINNSHRFNQSIADLSAPLAIRDDKDNFVGLNTHSGFDLTKIQKFNHDVNKLNVLFLFDENSVENVLPSYGKYLSEIFTDQYLNDGVFYAVGATHKEHDSENTHFPVSVADYWPQYKKRYSSQSMVVDHFFDFYSKGFMNSKKNQHSSHTVDSIAEAILFAANFQSGFSLKTNTLYHHKKLVSILQDAKELEIYYKFLCKYCSTYCDKKTWNAKWKTKLYQIVVSIAESPRHLEQDQFWDYIELSTIDETVNSRLITGNTYSYNPENGASFNINLGSIHSVKGQTHTATLILETFYYTHYWKKLLPFIVRPADKITNTQKKNTDKGRRLHYVAMTRPSHLVCIAIPKQVFNENKDYQNDKYKQYFDSRWKTINLV